MKPKIALLCTKTGKLVLTGALINFSLTGGESNIEITSQRTNGSFFIKHLNVEKAKFNLKEIW